MNKKNALLKRQKAHARAVLRLHGAAVANIDPDDKQGAISLKTGLPMRPGAELAGFMCDYTHKWAVYAAVFCRRQDGQPYIKGQAGRVPGEYYARDLEVVFDSLLLELLESCNRAHIVGTGWIAAPFDTWIDHGPASDIFEAMGAWQQKGVFDYERVRKELTGSAT